MWCVKSVPVEFQDGRKPIAFAWADQDGRASPPYCVLSQVCAALKIPDSTWKGWLKPLQVVQRDLCLIRLLRRVAIVAIWSWHWCQIAFAQWHNILYCLFHVPLCFTSLIL